MSAMFLFVLLLLTASSCNHSPTQPENPVQGLTLHGLDLSHHNIDNYGAVDWGQVRNAGYTFAFVKATDGYQSCWNDPTFVANIEGGHAAGLFMGAYHYARPDLNRDAVVEANCFLSRAGKYLTKGYLRPVLDVERGTELGKDALTNWIHLWMSTVRNRTGVEPIFYTYSAFIQHLNSSITRYNLWIAHYTRDPTGEPNIGVWPDWDFWQYTDRGSVPGVADPTLDLNVFNGDLARLKNEFVIR